MPTHQGQVAFAGGKVSAGDVDLWHTAIRAEEEVGLDPSSVHRVMRLDDLVTVTGYPGNYVGGYPAGTSWLQ